MSILPFNTIQFQSTNGRKYKTTRELFKDWDNNKDFKLENGQFFSKLDLSRLLTDFTTLYTKIGRRVVYIIRFGEEVKHL